MMEPEDGCGQSDQWGVLIRVVVTGTAFLWLLSTVEFDGVWTAIRSVPFKAVLACFLGVGLSFIAATARWRVLLLAVAPSTDAVPPFARLLRVTLIAAFVANILPGALGGDAARAFALRNLGSLASVSVVVVERCMSALALLVIGGACGVWADQLQPSHAIALALAGALAAGLLLFGSERASAAFAQTFRFGFAALGTAWVLSVLAQVAVALALVAVARGVSESLGWVEGLAVSLVAQFAALVPALAGLGPAQAAGATLLQSVGVGAEQGVAATLVTWSMAMVYVTVGGVLFTTRGVGQ